MAPLARHDLGGTGEPLVIVHGYTGSSDDFRHVAVPLTEHVRVTLVDQLGHGESPRAERYDLRSLTAALIEFLDASFEEPVHLLGHSMGGRTVLPIAADRPDLVRSLILMDTWADHADRGPDDDFYVETFAFPQAEALGRLDDLWSEPGPEHRLIVERWGQPWADTHWGYNSARLDPRARYELGRQVFAGDVGVLDRCREVSCPTTVIVGAFDAAFTSASERLAAAIPGSTLEVMDGAYHSPQLTHPEQWATIVLAHLERAAS